jgi:hypothetical protein
MTQRRLLLLLLLGVAVFLSATCYGQANDVAVSVGGIFSPNSLAGPTTGSLPCAPPGCVNPMVCIDCLSPNAAKSGVAFEGTLAHRVLNFDLVSLHAELPVMVAPNRVEGNRGSNFSQVFVTPALRVRFSLHLLSAFLSCGGGFGHFSPKIGLNNPSQTKGALQVGAGLDIGTPIPRIAFRAEVREFYTGDTVEATQHSIFAGGGLVLKF